MSMRLLALGLLASITFGASPSLAQNQFQPGQVIYFNYCGEKTEGKVISQDSSGVKIEAKNPLTGQYDGSNIRYVLPANITTAQPASTGGSAGNAGVTGGGNTQPQYTPASIQGTTPGAAQQQQAQPAQPQSTGGGGSPRIGRYHMYGFPSMHRMQLVGWFDLNSDGTYKTQSGGTGRYTLGGDGIQWVSGPYREQGFLGIVKIDRGGLTTRVTLTKTAGGNDRMVAFCSADK